MRTEHPIYDTVEKWIQADRKQNRMIMAMLDKKNKDDKERNNEKMRVVLPHKARRETVFGTPRGYQDVRYVLPYLDGMQGKDEGG